jgi:hypothetical protein
MNVPAAVDAVFLKRACFSYLSTRFIQLESDDDISNHIRTDNHMVFCVRQFRGIVRVLCEEQ